MVSNIMKPMLSLRKSLYPSLYLSQRIIVRWESNDKKITVYDPFVDKQVRDRKTFLEIIKIFEKNDTRRRGHVEFIYAAMAQMKQFDVHKDLEVYKALLDVLPKGKFIPTNVFQSEFMHYPKQQQCAVDVLEKMENNGVMPDTEMEQLLLNVFGRRGIPLRKYARMMYWMPKFKNLSPWYLPEKLPNDTLELAKLAIYRITSVDPNNKVDIWQTEEIEASLDKTWVVSAQSDFQRILLAEQPIEEPLVVKGPYEVYVKDQPVTYFILFGKIRPDPIDDRDLDDVSNIDRPLGIPGFMGKIYGSTLPAVSCTVHEQDDGTILSVCATGTSSRDSLLSWIRLLENHGNPLLAKIPVIFTLIAPPNDVSLYESSLSKDDSKNENSEKMKYKV